MVFLRSGLLDVPDEDLPFKALEPPQIIVQTAQYHSDDPGDETVLFAESEICDIGFGHYKVPVGAHDTRDPLKYPLDSR